MYTLSDFPPRNRLINGRVRRFRAFHVERFEPRILLAGDLVGFWRANDLVGTVDHGQAIASWSDSISNAEGFANGLPTLAVGEVGGRAGIKFESANGDGFKIRSNENPLNGLGDFTAAVTFQTSSANLVGDQDQWYRNTGLLDANSLGFSSDWGITINGAGQISAGLGGGFSVNPATLYSTATGLNDGQVHTVVFVRDGSEMHLYVDDMPKDQQAGTDAALSPSLMGIGQLATDANSFDGLIAEARLYNGALSDAEVGAVINDISSFYDNELPIANSDRYATVEDALIFTVSAGDGVLSNDTDADGDPLTAVLISPTSNGTISLKPDGSFVYDSNRDFFGEDRFTYAANDFRNSEPSTVFIDVAPVFDPVKPQADNYKSLPSEILNVGAAAGVLANDLNPDQANLTVQLVESVSKGSLQLNADGSFVYDPMGFSGATTFTYRVDDGTALSQPSTVTLVLNTPPVIQSDIFEIQEDEASVFTKLNGVLANDLDADGDNLTAILTGEPTNGSLEFQPDGSFRYTPNLNFFGTDTFRYKVFDGVDESVESTVRIDVVSVNDPPQVNSDFYVTLPDQLLSIPAEQGLLSNDFDVDGPADLSALLVERTANGVVEIQSSGAFTYQPNIGFVGLDSFTYRVTDSEANSAMQTVQIRVDPQPIRISEIMVANVDALVTRTRESAADDFRRNTEEAFDWIELQNPFDSMINVGGFYLTDNAEDLTKWQIPLGTTIAAHAEIVVFASGKNIVDPALDENGFFHTNFKLSAGGEYLAIVGSGNTVLHEYLSYPKQRPNISYGLDSRGNEKFFVDSTPGADNGAGLDGAVADTQFSVDRGFYNQAQSVTIATDTIGAEIYYTLNGSEPVPDNPAAIKYTQPVQVATTTTLRAAAFHTGLIPSNVDTQTYIFVDHVQNQANNPEGYPSEWKNRNNTGSLPADYEVDHEITQNPKYKDLIDDALLQVPTISIVAEVADLFDRDTGIYQNPMQSGVAWERPASVELIHPDGTVGFQIDAGLRIQGGASREPRKSPKHSFRLLFKDIYGNSKLRYPLFGVEAVDEFDTIILRAGFNQSYIHHNTFQGDNRGRAQYVRDQWAKDAQREMGWNAPHNSYAHLYINGMYWGLYNPTERPTDGFGAAYFGGEKDEYDVYNSGELLDGQSDSWNEMFNIALNRNLSDDEKYDALLPILDMDAYIDYMLLNHYGGNADWDDHNWYSMRRRTDDGQWYFFMWDSEFIFVNENENTIRVSDGPRFPARIMRELSDSLEFKTRLADRIQLHMYNDGALTPDKVVERWNARSDQITEAIIGESARWGDYRRDVDPNSFPAGVPFELLERDVHWVRERERLINNYFPNRTDTVIGQYRARDLFPSVEAPVFNQRGGTVSAESHIALEADDGLKIYYTLNGTDPRSIGGDVSADAIEFTGPFQLKDSTVVKVRALSADGEWSALDQATFLYETVSASPHNLRISEINYHPASATDAEIAAGFDNDDDFEFIELMNISNQTLDLSAVKLEQEVEGDRTVGVRFDFGTSSFKHLAPGEKVVVVEDVDAFVFRYSINVPVAGQWSGGLNNATELITLVAGDQTIHRFRYSDQWHPTTDGNGFTLEIIDADSPELDNWGLGTSWKPSEQLGGSPGDLPAAPIVGDSNHDGIFNSRDLTLVFIAGEYEDQIVGNSTFEEGDWNGDGDFNSGDLVYAFQAGTYIFAATIDLSGIAVVADESDRFQEIGKDQTQNANRFRLTDSNPAKPTNTLHPTLVDSFFQNNTMRNVATLKAEMGSEFEFENLK